MGAQVLPHLYQIQVDFEALSIAISTICAEFISRTYHRDTVYASLNALKRIIAGCYGDIYRVFETGIERRRRPR